MTYGERYKGAKERAEAFERFLKFDLDVMVAPIVREAFRWIDLEAPAEEPLPCPFCGKDAHPYMAEIGYCVKCHHCGYASGQSGCCTIESAIAAHNRVARAAKEKEANDANA